MCGITGIIDNNDAIIVPLYESLTNLQHRGQESSGIITFSSKTKKNYKSKEFNLVDSHLSKITQIEGNMGLGHVRYPTSGQRNIEEVQPFIISKPYGISLVHNGNIVNNNILIKTLENKGIYMESTSDSEIILNLFYFYIEKKFNQLTDESIIRSIKKITELCKGSYSIIIMINNYGLIAFRDKYGIRPLVYEATENRVAIASETIALSSNNYINVENGELVIIKNQESRENKLAINRHKIENEELRPCLFEYIYFARAESYINDVLVYNFREKTGEKIIEKIEKMDPNIIEEIDCIIPIPLTSLIAATKISNIINKPLKHIVVKNRYTHRTFINADEEIIKGIKKIKIIDELVKDKNILVVDDSIVRGNTSKYIIKELRKAGAKKSILPHVVHRCVILIYME